MNKNIRISAEAEKFLFLNVDKVVAPEDRQDRDTLGFIFSPSYTQGVHQYDGYTLPGYVLRSQEKGKDRVFFKAVSADEHNVFCNLVFANGGGVADTNWG